MKVFFSDFFYKTKPYIKKRGIYLNFSRLVSWLCWFPCLRWGVPDCRAISGGAGDLWLQGTWKRKQGSFKLLQTTFFLTRLIQVSRVLPLCWWNTNLLKWNTFMKLYGDLDVIVRCGRFKPPLAWTSTWKPFHFHLLWLNDAHGKTYLLFSYCCIVWGLNKIRSAGKGSRCSFLCFQLKYVSSVFWSYRSELQSW